MNTVASRVCQFRNTVRKPRPNCANKTTTNNNSDKQATSMNWFTSRISLVEPRLRSVFVPVRELHTDTLHFRVSPSMMHRLSGYTMGMSIILAVVVLALLPVCMAQSCATNPCMDGCLCSESCGVAVCSSEPCCMDRAAMADVSASKIHHAPAAREKVIIPPSKSSITCWPGNPDTCPPGQECVFNGDGQLQHADSNEQRKGHVATLNEDLNPPCLPDLS